MSRGNRKAPIFDDDEDRRRFLEVLDDAAARHEVTCLSYCLMGNHYHCVLETPHGNLSEAMHFVNGVYTQASNRRHARTGHLFEGRFVSLVIDSDDYLRTANTYVVLNPVAAHLVSSVGDWEWSSYRATAGLVPPPDFLRVNWIDGIFPGATRADTQRRYCAFVTAQSPDASPGALEDELLLGTPAFEQALRTEIGEALYRIGLPRGYRALGRPTLEALFLEGATNADRNSAILRAHVVHGYRLHELAACLELHPNTVSRIVSEVRRRAIRAMRR